MTAESAADFFKLLGQGTSQHQESNNQQVSNNNIEESKQNPKASKEEQLEDPKKLQFVTETVSKNVNWDEGAEGIIKRSLLFGNLEYAAEVALKCGRTTEALLIAEAGGEKLLE